MNIKTTEIEQHIFGNKSIREYLLNKPLINEERIKDLKQLIEIYKLTCLKYDEKIVDVRRSISCCSALRTTGGQS